MYKIILYIEAFLEGIGRLVSWLTLGMVLVTFTVVILRYFFNIGWIAMQESITYMHAMVFMLGAAYTLRHEGHVRVDIFYERLSDKGKARVNLLGTLLLLFPFCIFILWTSWAYVGQSWQVFEGSQEAGGLPAVWLLKGLILLLPALLLLQGLALFCRSWLILRGLPVPAVKMSRP
ncbi:MAG: TRAP transporter small permease subunit [gamma proteobacterium symbiont of Bathyaustriella thionipta]|nr:TRAP transporter small permease subunit [gamma proteobacterium symbiont of Bathyaustriella thionipta]